MRNTSILFIKKIITFLFVFVGLILYYSQGPSALVIDSTPQIHSFDLGGNTPEQLSNIRVTTEELTGKTFSIYFSLEGDLDANCTKIVSVSHNEKLQYVYSASPFFPSGTQNPVVSHALQGNESQTFRLDYRFPGYTTCDGTIGEITIKIELSCGGIFEKTIFVKARAQNTWVFSGVANIDGYLCGTYYYQANAKIFHPNGNGFGVYEISGRFYATNTDGSVKERNFVNKRISFSFNYNAHDDSVHGCLEDIPSHTEVHYDFRLPSQHCNVQIQGSVLSKNAFGTVPLTIENWQAYNSVAIFDDGYNDTYNPIPPGTLSSLVLSISTLDTFVNTTNVLANVNIDGPITITNIVDSDGIVYPITSNNEYNFFWNEIEGKSITFSFIVNSTAPAGSLINFETEVKRTAEIKPEYECSSCTFETSTHIVEKEKTILVKERLPIENNLEIKKCLPNNTGYRVGDQIDFQVFVVNATNSSETIAIQDQLVIQNQNLTLVGTPTLGYYTRSEAYNLCDSMGSFITNQTDFLVTENHSSSTLHWDISGMPNDPYKVLVFNFSAIVNPQTGGVKTNKLSNGSEVNYQVFEYGELKIEKKSNVDSINVGEEFEYEIIVRNAGTLEIGNLVISDSLPDCVVLNSTEPIVVTDQNSQTVSYTSTDNLIIRIQNRNLNSGEYLKITIPVKKVKGGFCCNVASVNGEVIAYGTTTNADSSPTSACVTSPPVPAIEVSKCLVEPKEYYQIGDQISFRILVKNTGDLEGNIRLLDELQNLNQNLTLVNTPSIKYFSSGDCQTLGNEIGVPNTFQFTENHSVASLDWTLSNIPFDAQKVFVIEYTATINPQEFGSKKNEVKNTDGEILDDVDYTVVGIPGVEISKTADRQYVEVGNNFNYIISIKNTGQTSLHTISVEDLLPTCVELSGTIVAKDKNENFVNFVQTTNVLLDFENYELLPNDILVISIPVKKATSGSCCNVATVKVECKITHEKISVSTNENSACIKEANSACSYEFSKLKRAVPDLFPQAVENELAVNFIHHIDKEYDDIDNDGDVDILYVKTGNLKVLINSAGASNPPVFPSVGIDVAIQYPNILDHTNFPNSAITVLSHRLFDWDNDGDKDLIILAGKPAGSGKFLSGIYLYLNGGTGNFSMPVTLLDATRQGDYYGYHPSNAFPADYYQFIEVGDLNNDGLPDLLISGKDRIYGTVYFENTGTIVNPSFSLVSPQQFIPNATFQFWSQNPAFPRPTGSHQVPELHSIYGGGLDVFISNPLVEQNAQYGGGRLYYHPNLGGQTSGVLPNFNYTGFTNQFGLNDDWSSNYPNADFPNENSSPLLCDWIVTRFTDYFGTGCPIVIVYNNCTKKFYYYDQETPTLQMNDYNASRFIVDLYPNPAKHEVFYQISKNLMLKDIKIFDASGKLIAKPNIKQNRINTANLPSGIYYVHFITDQKIITKKLIVK